MSLNFVKIPTFTTELAASVRLKIDVSAFSRSLFTRSFLNLQITRTCLLSWMSSTFCQIGPPTTELAAIERLKHLIDLLWAI